ncbi:MAG: flotillin family protein [Proteobacteria bacterium]|nr:flotillin family protein [Pseudomonadota bacterium]MBQ4359142.1 flotillin family protein [Pseudomonadota bacterium]
MDDIWIIGIVIVAAIVVISLIAGFMKRYRRCPSDKVLVIYGKLSADANGEQRSARCIHGGAAFVWPLIQDCQFLDLTPFSINIDLKGALSKQNIRVDVPASFTVGISTEPKVMQNAAERLLGLSLHNVVSLANEIILGQLRLIIATMDIEELNTQRDKFMSEVQQCVETELKKIGLKLINANLTDIRDESGYIEALGKEAEAKALNEAKRNVAERNREGNTGEKNEKAREAIELAEKDREQRAGVAKEMAAALAAEKEAETKQRTDIANADAAAIAAEKAAETKKRADIANAEAAAIAAEKAAETKKRADIANANATAVASEKAAEKEQRAAVANANAEAIAAENQAAAAIALSEASRREAEAEARARAYSAEKVKNARALSEAYAAEEKAEIARAERQKATMQADVLVQADIEKRRIEIAAEAEAEAIRRKAKGQADAMLVKMQAEADGIKAQLAKRAEGFMMLVKAANGDPDAAVRLMMTDKVEDIVKAQVDAIKGVNIDKITVWDSMSGQDGASTTSNFLSSMIKAVPPMKDVYNMVGLDVPVIKDKPADKKEA